MDRPAKAGDLAPRGDEGAKRYRWFALGLLVVVYIFNFLDRQIFAILQQAIKVDLGLSDTELGFLGGFAFAIFYTFLGIPIARLADRYSRSKIIAASLALWSAMTALCGAANSFLTLALARIGVGVGEAGCSPPAHSLIADYFAPHQRSTALAIYSLGIPIGGALGFIIGGYVNLYLGWREAFFVVGVPGVLLSIFIALRLREPVRGSSEARVQTTAKPPPIGEVIRTLWHQRTFHQLCFAFALTAYAGYGTNQWLPTYFIRTFELDTGTVGLVMALGNGLAGGLSTLAGGFIADRLALREQRWICWLPAWALLFSIPFTVALLFQADFGSAVILLLVGSLFSGIHLGPVFGVVQTLAPLRMRALSASVLLFATNLVGMGLGPLTVGIVSDGLDALGIQAHLRWGILVNVLVTFWAVAHYFAAARTLREDMARNN